MDKSGHRSCPRCDYDLTGLPDEHICPECGFGYDAYSTNIPLLARRSQRIAIIGSVLNFGYLIFVWRRRPFGMGDWLPIGIFMVFTVALLVHLRRASRASERMIFARAGFMLYSPTSTSTPVPWSVIKIRKLQLGGRSSVYRTNGRTRSR